MILKKKRRGVNGGKGEDVFFTFPALAVHAALSRVGPTKGHVTASDDQSARRVREVPRRGGHHPHPRRVRGTLCIGVELRGDLHQRGISRRP